MRFKCKHVITRTIVSYSPSVSKEMVDNICRNIRDKSINDIFFDNKIKLNIATRSYIE